MVLFYAWQHFSAVQDGYEIETQKTQRDQLWSKTAPSSLRKQDCVIPGGSTLWRDRWDWSRRCQDR